MASRPIPRKKTSPAVVDYILEQIFEGHLKSGDRIDLDQVCRDLDVSRLPVREAIVMLERDGIVTSTYHRGVFVEPFDAKSVIDDFEIIGLLSGVAVRRLADEQDQGVIAELEGLVDQLRAAPPGDRDRTIELVRTILTTEHRAGGSRRLRAELRAFTGYLPLVFRISTNRSHDETVEAHARVVRAVAAGDGEKAARYRVDDFRDAGQKVVQELARRGVLSGE
ncbi:GntR family transcriptional regulator [Frankia sp. AgB1.9]|uniref:GntR family transcriptional regulator n=1 Tax=unclassified Frankia TaxID=2632575 RepID=UPI001933F3F9|nr:MULTISPECIES: GntR family transcriptional regulator [unclassified Frankia]MBL7492637.1 GntR family transcriptional regulator [Frankia sp. AgW1.1]MBL7549340.1 GntR family transcriptional regulator [Frankia sp. AgB1.9]MBL7619193.1 GntR family transcriptional regulator [Frankia sp. AgB1.8]